MALLFRARCARWSVAAFALATSLAAAAPLRSDDTAPPRLRDAVRAVWEHNPAVRAAEARLDASRASAQAAGRPLYNPDLELMAENADVDTRSVGISQAIDLFGKGRARETAATAAVRAAGAERDEVRQRVALDWLRGFAAYRSASERAEAGARRVDLIGQFAALAERRFRAGDIPVLERDLANLALQEARAQQAELVAEQAKARQTLTSVGGTPTSLPPLPGALPPPIESPFVPRQLADLPAVRRAQAELEVAEARVTVAERDRRADPTISLTGGRVTDGPFNDRLVAVTLKVPLFVRNSYSAEVTAARSNADAADANQRDVVLRANAEAEQAASSYAALRDAAAAWRESRAASAAERAALLQKLWEAGEISASDYLVQLKQSIDTELTALSLQGRVWDAWADWLQASGSVGAWLGLDDGTARSKELPR